MGVSIFDNIYCNIIMCARSSAAVVSISRRKQCNYIIIYYYFYCIFTNVIFGRHSVACRSIHTECGKSSVRGVIFSDTINNVRFLFVFSVRDIIKYTLLPTWRSLYAYYARNVEKLRQCNII